MSALDNDLQRAATGHLTREALRSRHPHTNVDAILDLHEHLVELRDIDAVVPDWRDVAPRLALRPGNALRRRVKIALAAAGAALVLVPVTADAIEAIAPDAVRDTVIDRITDVLPWDTDSAPTDNPTDAPITDRPEVDEVPGETDAGGPDHVDVPAADDVDAPADVSTDESPSGADITPRDSIPNDGATDGTDLGTDTARDPTDSSGGDTRVSGSGGTDEGGSDSGGTDGSGTGGDAPPTDGGDG